jgi:hypothetical protein
MDITDALNNYILGNAHAGCIVLGVRSIREFIYSALLVTQYVIIYIGQYLSLAP